MPESASSGRAGRSDELTTALSKPTLAELRAVHGDLPATRAALLRFFRCGFKAGLSLEECMRLLFLEPSQAGSLVRRVGYAEHEYEFLIRLVRELPLLDSAR